MTNMDQAVARVGSNGLDLILAAINADPNVILRFADDISRPYKQVYDCITKTDTRRALFEEIRVLCQPEG